MGLPRRELAIVLIWFVILGCAFGAAYYGFTRWEKSGKQEAATAPVGPAAAAPVKPALAPEEKPPGPVSPSEAPAPRP